MVEEVMGTYFHETAKTECAMDATLNLTVNMIHIYAHKKVMQAQDN